MTGTHRPAAGGRRDADDADASAAACEDLALLQRLRSGEDAAFGELFSRHSDAVRRLAMGLVNDRAEAEDLAAEAFFRVLQAVRRGAGPVDNVRGYLLIVTRRVAWEWNARKRDVPVSDEELSHRVGAGPDNTGQSTERTLITRAFTSLPERWRSVLWKVEVEGERPAVVAGNFGLSPNATAALARRARQGLRAAYLQAHLTVDRGSTGCRSVLEKLGAYTAGSIKGTERRKVRAHLSVCPECTSMQAELQDVCSGLRAHAAYLAAPVAGVALWQQINVATSGSAAGLGAVKGLLSSAKVQVTLAATSAAAVGVFGLAVVPWGTGGDSVAYSDFEGTGPTELVLGPDPSAAGGVAPPSGSSTRPTRPQAEGPPQSTTQPAPGGNNVATPATPPPAAEAQKPATQKQQPPPTQAAASQVVGAPRTTTQQNQVQQPPAGNTKPLTQQQQHQQQQQPPRQPSGLQRENTYDDGMYDPSYNDAGYYDPSYNDAGYYGYGQYDESLPVISTSSYTDKQWELYNNYYVYTETTVTTRVNSAQQTKVTTTRKATTRSHNARGWDDGQRGTVNINGGHRRR
ncbi:sigma-70 family RNA polymerase sigma factor [Actinokineospora auranticolor]|uniref:RNA polymerase sigma factor (Sigma-70 family) n=1 Tax=Actinokineospora auranticolor TaxID=155976 RepID=A0A2S6GSJ5_9PSEU|nr:sigma-70 family RNA polymerase sigma factor [Actinokineospora auranticolor]PPK68169.1 RNA polymerase sigma factor (sigma-70 family) [Actinokineospora auranticolor]